MSATSCVGFRLSATFAKGVRSPRLHRLVGIGTGFIAFALAAPLSFFTIAAAWVVYRPVLGVLFIVVGV